MCFEDNNDTPSLRLSCCIKLKSLASLTNENVGGSEFDHDGITLKPSVGGAVAVARARFMATLKVGW